MAYPTSFFFSYSCFHEDGVCVVQGLLVGVEEKWCIVTVPVASLSPQPGRTAWILTPHPVMQLFKMERNLGFSGLVNSITVFAEVDTDIVCALVSALLPSALMQNL